VRHRSVKRLSLTEWNTDDFFFLFFGGIGVDGRVALMWILKKWVLPVDWIHLAHYMAAVLGRC
jgi:hypothetical protein